MIILIAGTPGVGKTYLASKIASSLGIPCFNAHEEAIRMVFVDEKDHIRNADVIDEEKVEDIIVDLKNKNADFVFEGLLSHYANPQNDRLCIIIKCDIKTLNQRLIDRGYSREKIRENIDSEIFQIIENEAVEQGHKIIVFDNTDSSEKEIDSLLSKIKDFQDNISSK